MSTKIVNKASKVRITVPSEGHFLLLFRRPAKLLFTSVHSILHI